MFYEYSEDQVRLMDEMRQMTTEDDKSSFTFVLLCLLNCSKDQAFDSKTRRVYVCCLYLLQDTL
jgi:hypothetical protein